VQTTQNTKKALTHDPLVILVDESSASASEILSGETVPGVVGKVSPTLMKLRFSFFFTSKLFNLAGALRDNHRALIIGEKPTFGKGRIQTVYELQDGSALFLTVAKYTTPDGNEIDMKGDTKGFLAPPS
jgi:carboxyl-terminal processing protease